MADELIVVSTKLDPETLESLDYQCGAQARNRSQTLALALREWLERQESEPKPKRKAK